MEHPNETVGNSGFIHLIFHCPHVQQLLTPAPWTTRRLLSWSAGQGFPGNEGQLRYATILPNFIE